MDPVADQAIRKRVVGLRKAGTSAHRNAMVLLQKYEEEPPRRHDHDQRKFVVEDQSRGVKQLQSMIF